MNVHGNAKLGPAGYCPRRQETMLEASFDALIPRPQIEARSPACVGLIAVHGKVERFHQTLSREWAYGVTYHDHHARHQALPYWLDHYNTRRPHSSSAHDHPSAAFTTSVGRTDRGCAALFGVSPATAHRWRVRWRQASEPRRPHGASAGRAHAVADIAWYHRGTNLA